jgi:hypothetical protein
VNQALSNPRLNIQFRRSLSPGDLALWVALRTDLDACNLSTGQDWVSWALEPLGHFSINSMYRCLL